MENVLQQIITEEVNKNFVTEKAFYEDFLDITQQSWNRWKRGERGFSDKNKSRLKRLYTDYEWMLVQKVVKELEVENPDKDTSPYEIYLETKKAIAKDWIKNDAAIDISDNDPIDDATRKNPGTKVAIKIHYDLPLESKDDVITFHFSKLKGKLKSKTKKRKKWFKKNKEYIV